MKRHTDKSLLKGGKGVRVLYLPPDAAYEAGGYFAPPPLMTQPALTQGASAAGGGASAASVALSDAAAVKESFLDKALDAYELSYKELAANWRSLEVKAQGNITVAGIFIAAAFAFLQRIQPELRTVDKMVLGVALVFLVASVLLAVRVLLVKSVPAPIFGDMIVRFATSLYRADDGAQFPQAAMARYKAYFEEWEKVINATQRLTLRKGRRLSQAQWCLQVAIVAAAALAFIRLFV
jgi:hypothetical protein